MRSARIVRERLRPLRVVVSIEERAQIETHAKATSMSVSAFLRTLGLGYQPVCTYDAEAVMALAKVAGDQGRLGGLLKMWLTERPSEGAREIDVIRLLREIEALVPIMREKLDRL